MTFFAPILAAALLALPACAPYPLHARMSDAEVRSALDQHFSRGQSAAQANHALDALRVSPGNRFTYPATPDRPQVLLARVFEAGGPWIEREDYTVEWVDVSFVFDPPDRLDRWLLYRDNVRYFQGEPIYGPRREPTREARRWPISIPPPRDPLEGVN